MKLQYKNLLLERVLILINSVTSALVVASFILLYGFNEPVLDIDFLHFVQVSAFLVFVAEKLVRFYNALSRKEFLLANWFEIPLIAVLIIGIIGSGRWYSFDNPAMGRVLSLGIYLILQVIAKSCRGVVQLASSGQNPTKALISIFVVLIIIGASLLMLPRSYVDEPTSFIDALFTATSATCVTGLIVQETGTHFSLVGQIVILSLIQLGGLGIVIFGAILALLLGQALSVRESVAMRDLLSAQTLGKIGNIIGFIFIVTIVMEGIGAILMMGMWGGASQAGTSHSEWFSSIFHSISAFCNAGFSLYPDSLMQYKHRWQVYGVVCVLIITGGLGFGVLLNLWQVFTDKIRRFLHIISLKGSMSVAFEDAPPKRIALQTKLVVSMSTILILTGMVLILVMENNTGAHVHNQASGETRFLDAFFQSVTARTAGFNTVEIAEMKPASRFVLGILMFIGGSPGSPAGGIKTATFSVILMAVYASIRKRSEIDVFKRSIGTAVAGRAITVILLFISVFIIVSLALSITERDNNFEMGEIMFEVMSALGTVGLSCGITGELTTAGKLFITATMLIGRLGPLTLLAAITFNLRPAVYSYPEEPIIVG